MGNTKNAVIYARYSSHGQNEQSIEQQFEVCEKYAKQNGYTVVGHYSDEAKTGTNDNRPDFRRMITDSSWPMMVEVISVESELRRCISRSNEESTR